MDSVRGLLKQLALKFRRHKVGKIRITEMPSFIVGSAEFMSPVSPVFHTVVKVSWSQKVSQKPRLEW